MDFETCLILITVVLYTIWAVLFIVWIITLYRFLKDENDD